MLKLRIYWLAVVALVLVLGAPAYAADGPYYIHNTEVNLRESPNGGVILVFDVDDKVFVIQRDGNWSYVSAPGREAKGWVWSAYIGEERLAADEESENRSPESGVWSPEPGSAALRGGGLAKVMVEDVAIEGAEPLQVYAFSEVETSDTVPGQLHAEDGIAEQNPAEARISEGFVPDIKLKQAPEESRQGIAETNKYRPKAEPPATGEAQAAFYQPYERKAARITTPESLGGARYGPVGGNDIALISGSSVNVREGASLKHGIIGRVGKGDKVYIVAQDDAWFYVSIPEKGLKGWVFGEYLDQLPRVEITGSKVRLRERPGTSARIKTELDKGEVLYQFERSGGWVLIASSASGLKGWVHGGYVKKTAKPASRPYRVNGGKVNLRASPSVDARILATLAQGTEVQVFGRSERWSFIESSGQQGWMYSEYLTPMLRGTTFAGSGIGLRLISRAKALEGTPYSWGGSGGGSYDCSGLIYALLIEEGAEAASLPRRASEQMAQLGVRVGKEDVKPGDLVFFSTYKPGPSHVGIYIGDGDFIHASSARGKVTINNMSEGYYKRRFVGARRISESELRRLK